MAKFTFVSQARATKCGKEKGNFVELRRSCYLIAAPADLPSGRVLVVTLLYISSDDFSIEFKVEDTKHVIKSFMRNELISW